MFNMLRFLTAISTLLAGTAVPHDAAGEAGPSRPAIVTTGMSAGERDAVVRSAGLFAEAGLELPAVTIHRHPGRAACGGHDGQHRAVGTRSEIDICTVDGLAWEERVILHELSHAWAAHFLTPAHKNAFRKLRGFEYWQDYERTDWRYNGTEQAAEIMVWALSDHPVHVAQIDHDSCKELRTAYVALTGLAPLHGYTARCDESSPDRRS
jgi:hypothetical protein